jgi:ribosomal small subunit protein bTHX
MGKGDKKSKRGKIIIGSHGVRRPRRKATGKPEMAIPEAQAVPEKSKVSATAEKPAEPKPKVTRKPKAE